MAKSFRLERVAVAVLLMIGAVSAQAQNNASLEEIVVTGTRSSLQDAIDYKRNASGIVDAISAEDIGELPDGNVAESLQRITGVQITREQGAGAQVRIRGLSAKTLINGREAVGQAAPGASGGTTRDFNFRNLNSDFFQTLEVAKSADASQIEGALGGVVNLVTLKPTTLTEPLMSVTISGNRSERAKETDYSYSAIFGNAFADDTLGVLFGVSFDNFSSREDNFLVRGGFRPFDVGFETGFDYGAGAPGTNDVLRPNDLRTLTEYQDESRVGINATVNWAPNDSFDLQLDATHNELDLDWERYFFRTLFVADYEPTSLVLSDIGAVTAGTALNQRVQPDGRRFPEEQKTTTAGLKASFVNDGWDATLDVSFSDSSRLRTEQFLRFEGYDPVTRAARTATIDFDLLGPGDLPSFVLNNADGSAYDLTTPNLFRTELIFDREFDGDQDQFAVAGDFGRDLQIGDMTRLSAGFRSASGEFNEMLTQYFPFRPAAGNTAFFDPVTGSQFTLAEGPDGAYVGQSRGTIFSGFSGDLPRSWIAAQIPNVGVGSPNQQFRNDLNIEDAGFEVRADGTSMLEEDTLALYVMADFEGELGGRSYQANVGVRYVETELVSRGRTSGTDAIDVSISNDYDNFLPSASINIDMADRWKLRVAAASVVQRPPFADLLASFDLDRSAGTARGGNPNLDPFEANQLDVSAEFYRNPDALYSLAVFYKDVKNFTSLNTTFGEIPGVTRLDGGTEFVITQPVNGGSADVTGFEISAQEAFTLLPGFLSNTGMQVNYTYTDVDTDSGQPFPLLSENAWNVIGYYDDGPLNVRVAYSFRSEFFSSGEGGNAAQTQGLFEYTGDEGFLDMSISYKFNDHLKLQFEGFNLTETLQERYLENSGSPRNFGVFDRRFHLGAKYTF